MPEKYFTVPEFLTRHLQILQMGGWGAVALPAPLSPTAMHIMLAVHEKILQYRDNNNSVSSLFLDFAKAFDSVNHQIFLSKLEHYGVSSSLELFKSYLTNRKQYTFLNGEYKSSMLDIDTGVTQGSVIGPLFFLIFINDFPNCVQSDCVLYADDAAVICCNKTISELQLQTEQEIKGVIECTSNHKLLKH